MRTNLPTTLFLAGAALLYAACSNYKIEELLEDRSEARPSVYTYTGDMWEKARDIARFLEREQADAAVVEQIFGADNLLNAGKGPLKMEFFKQSPDGLHPYIDKKCYIITFHLDEQRKVRKVEFEEGPFPFAQ